MDLVSVILISVGLAMDCFAVSTLKGVQMMRWHQTGRPVPENAGWWALLMAVLFGFFQGLMPMIGYAAGSLFEDWMLRYNHWIALVLLLFIGGKMLVEGLTEKVDDAPKEDSALFSVGELLLLAVATSIDAMATGLIFVPYSLSEMWTVIGIIALGSFLFSRFGFTLGTAVGRRLRVNPEILGGIVLILLGLKIFAEGMGWI